MGFVTSLNASSNQFIPRNNSVLLLQATDGRKKSGLSVNDLQTLVNQLEMGLHGVRMKSVAHRFLQLYFQEWVFYPRG